MLDASFPVLKLPGGKCKDEYPVSINGKPGTTMVLSLDATQQQVEELVLTNDTVLKRVGRKSPKRSFM